MMPLWGQHHLLLPTTFAPIQINGLGWGQVNVSKCELYSLNTTTDIDTFGLQGMKMLEPEELTLLGAPLTVEAFPDHMSKTFRGFIVVATRIGRLLKLQRITVLIEELPGYHPNGP